MKISKISIKNYRSCNEAIFIPHESLSVLIGPNGSGKTNILSAIKLLPALCNRGRNLVELEPITSVCEIRTSYEIDNLSLTHIAKLNIVTNERNLDEIIRSDEHWLIPSAEGTRKKVDIPSWILSEIARASSTSTLRRAIHLSDYLTKRKLDSKALAVLEKAVGFVTGISYYSASQFTNPGTCPISFEVEGDAERRTGISISGHKRLLYDMYQESRKTTDAYSEFLSLVGQDGIGLVELTFPRKIDTG